MSCTEETRERLLLEIARCKQMQSCLANRELAHACSPIVGNQSSRPNSPHQVPEPWNGNLGDALVLFISSNPSISQEERYPTIDWPDERIKTFFKGRFGDLPSSPIRGGNKVLNKDGARPRAVPFLSWARLRAVELLNVPPAEIMPGQHYALSEVVHCKSKGEVGVSGALKFCSKAYTERVVTCSGARILVFVGDAAKAVAHDVFGINPLPIVQAPREVCGKQRMATFLPHPNSHKKCKFSSCCPEDVDKLRTFLRAN